MIEKLTIVRDIADDQVGLLADFDGAKPLGPIQGGRGIQCQGRDDFRWEHLHLRAGQSADQGQVFARAGARIAIASQGHRQAGLDQPSGWCVVQS